MPALPLQLQKCRGNRGKIEGWRGVFDSVSSAALCPIVRREALIPHKAPFQFL